MSIPNHSPHTDTRSTPRRRRSNIVQKDATPSARRLIEQIEEGQRPEPPESYFSTPVALNRRMGIVYVFHFTQPVKHARHYIGWSCRFPERLKEQQSGGSQAARLVQVAREQGSVPILVLTMVGDQALEYYLKSRKSTAHFCPICYKQKQRDRDRRQRQAARKSKSRHAPGTGKSGSCARRAAPASPHRTHTLGAM